MTESELVEMEAHAMRDGSDAAEAVVVCIEEIRRLHAEKSAFWDCARQELLQFRTVCGRLRDWANTYGATLCPGYHADTFGDGVREAKRQVADMLNSL